MSRFSIWIALLLGACAGNGVGAEGPVPASADPRVTIVSPAAGDGRYGEALTVTYEVYDFTLDPTGEATGDAVGHVHLYLDGALVGESTETTFTFEDVSSGDHVLRARLATQDHDEIGLSSEVEVSTRIPSLQVVSPADGTEATASSIPVSLSVTDFEISPEAAFAEPAFGRGRYRLLVDDVEVDLGVDPAGTDLTQLGEGEHRVVAELVSSDGNPLDPPVFDELFVGVVAGAPYIAVERAPYRSVYDSASVPLSVVTANAPVDYHVYVDGVFAQHATSDTSLLHLAPGYHYVELRLTDGGSELPVKDHAHVFIAPDRPDVTITSPGDQWGVAADLDLSVAVENFLLEADAEAEAAARQGHWVALVDGVEAAQSATGAVHLTGLPPGEHQLRVELRGTDGAPLDPPVFDQITVSVE